MSLNLLKYIGLGILGLGGVSSVAALSSSRVREFIGISSVISKPTPSPTELSTSPAIPDDSVSASELDRRWKFLYELSKKVFGFLKDKKKGEADQKENVIKGLKDKFNGSLESEEDTWEHFKSLCDEQKNKETEVGSDVTNAYSRLCFLDKSKKDEYNFEIKGLLFNGVTDLCYSEFFSGTKSNFELWYKFQTIYPNSNPSDVFDNGLSTNPEGIKDFLDGATHSDSLISLCEAQKQKET